MVQASSTLNLNKLIKSDNDHIWFTIFLSENSNSLVSQNDYTKDFVVSSSGRYLGV